jgi:transposase
MNKSDKIRQSILKTKEKRKTQICKVYTIKFDKSHLSKEKLNWLYRLFLEAKWIYNSQLSSDDIFSYSDKIKEVEILNKDKQIEKREINCLSSQMKQSLVDRTKQNIINLSKKKKKGVTVGRLKFRSKINSIPLKQVNNTYKIENNKYIKIQGFKKHFKVNGLKQIPENSDFANATLIKQNNNFYVKIITFQQKTIKQKTNNNIGLDFGIKDNIIDSNGNKYNFSFPETKQLKKISKKMNRAKKGSKNRYILKLKLKNQYEKISNKKKDAKNKFVSKLIKNNDIICVQNEMIHQWHKSKMKGFGRRIQHSIMGGIISDLKMKSETIIIPRNFPSTKLCPSCGVLNKHTLDQRIYNCNCGYSDDRDIHSAKNILIEGLKIISMEHRNQMPLEKISDLNKTIVFDKQFSMKKEAKCL